MSESPEDEQDNTISAEILPARFRHATLIGKGGMAMVFRAFDKSLERTVAIKLLCFDGATSEKIHQRFFQEAKTLSKLDHPNILRILGTGLTKGNDPFHIMEFLEGHSLADELKEGKLAKEKFFDLMIQVGEGLAYAHKNGVLHRDLKPSNIFVLSTSEEPTKAKILDFGIATVVDEQDPTQNLLDATQGTATKSDTKTLTRSNELLGSPAYMSPEQCMGIPATKLSDIYAYGCILYECLSGHTPFEVISTMDIMYKHIHESPDSLESRAQSALAKRVGKLVDDCLKKDPTQRPASVQEIVSLLQESEKNGLNLNEFVKAIPAPRKSSKAIYSVIILIAAIMLFVALNFHKNYQVSQIKVKHSSLTPEQEKEKIRTERDIIPLKKDCLDLSKPEAKRKKWLLAMTQASEYLADLQVKNGERDKATETLNEALNICDKAKSSIKDESPGLLKGSIYSTMGELNASDQDLAEGFFKKALQEVRDAAHETESAQEIFVQSSIFKFYMSHKDWVRARKEFTTWCRIRKKAEQYLKREQLEDLQHEIRRYLQLISSEIALNGQSASLEEAELCVDMCDYEINTAGSDIAVPALGSCMVPLNNIPKDKRYFTFAHHIYELLSLGFKHQNEPALSAKYEKLAQEMKNKM